jgi:hypothetical protein
MSLFMAKTNDLGGKVTPDGNRYPRSQRYAICDMRSAVSAPFRGFYRRKIYRRTMIKIVPAPIYITTPIALTTLNEDVGKRVNRFIEALARFAVCALVNIA